MIKLKYTWAFVVAVLGNIFLYVEIAYRLLDKYTSLSSSNYDYINQVYGTIFFCWGIFMINQVWLNQFKGDQKWPLTIIGLCFPGFFGYFRYLEERGRLEDVHVFYSLICCLAILMLFYSIRFWKKPPHIRSQLGLFKWLIAMAFLGGFLIGSCVLFFNTLVGVSDINIPKKIVVPLMFIATQIALPLLMLLNVIDLHKRDRRRQAQSEFDMIESLGKS